MQYNICSHLYATYGIAAVHSWKMVGVVRVLARHHLEIFVFSTHSHDFTSS